MIDKTAGLSNSNPKIGNRASQSSILLAAFIVGATFSLPAAAKLYKWVDSNGTTHYGETIPPEYASKDHAELNQAGRVVKTEEAVTPEKRRAKEREEAKKREEENAALEQKRRDNTLTNTYSSVEEIDIARKRNLQQLETRINALNSAIKIANENLIKLQDESANYTNASKPIPDSLAEDLKEAKQRLEKLQKDMERPATEKKAMEARYDADKVRYMELTGKK